MEFKRHCDSKEGINLWKPFSLSLDFVCNIFQHSKVPCINIIAHCYLVVFHGYVAYLASESVHRLKIVSIVPLTSEIIRWFIYVVDSAFMALNCVESKLFKNCNSSRQFGLIINSVGGSRNKIRRKSRQRSDELHFQVVFFTTELKII